MENITQRILLLIAANTNPMLFTPNDTAPKAGEYKVYSGQGNCIGSVLIQEGDMFPPTPNLLCYYENTVDPDNGADVKN